MEKKNTEIYEKASRLLNLCMSVTTDRERAKDLAKQMAINSIDIRAENRNELVENVKTLIDNM